MFKAIIVSLVAGAAYMIGQLFISKHQAEVSQVITKIEGSIQQTLGNPPAPAVPTDNSKPLTFPHYKECHYFFLSKACKVGLWGMNENSCVELPNYSGEGLIADAQQCYLGQFTAGKFHGKGQVYYAHGGKYEGLFLEGKKVESVAKAVETPPPPPKVEPEIPKPPASFANYEACHQFFTQRNCQTAMLWNTSKNQCTTRNNYNGEAIFSLNQQCYFGAFSGGKYQGKGTLYYVGGEKYEGNFQAGKKHGQGTLITRESQLAGQWQDDKWLSAPR